MVNRADTNTTLFSTKADSRLTTESSSGCPRSWSLRHARSPRDETSTKARNPRKYIPTGPDEKAWIEESTPERVRKVPKMVRLKAMMISSRFQVLSMPRRSCTCTECRNAVAGSQGMKAAFSTGSQAQ